MNKCIKVMAKCRLCYLVSEFSLVCTRKIQENTQTFWKEKEKEMLLNLIKGSWCYKKCIKLKQNDVTCCINHELCHLKRVLAFKKQKFKQISSFYPADCINASQRSS